MIEIGGINWHDFRHEVDFFWIHPLIVASSSTSKPNLLRNFSIFLREVMIDRLIALVNSSAIWIVSIF